MVWSFWVRRSRSNTSTAISASDTGDKASPLVQFFSGVLNIDKARAPASRTASARRAACFCRSTTSVAGNSQALHAHRRRIGAVTEDEVVSRCEALEYFGEMPGDGDFTHWKSKLAVLDPKPRGAAAIVAGHQIDADADQVGDIETVRDLGNQLVAALAAGGEMQVARPGRGRRRHAAIGVAGGGKTELATGRAVEDPGFQDAALDHFARAGDDALGVERPRAQAAPAQRIVDDVDIGRKNLRAELFAQEARLARDRGAVDGVGEVADQRAGDAGVEHHRHAARRDLARIEPLDGALAGAAADSAGAFHVGGMQRRGV